MPLQFHSDQFGDYDAASPPPLPGPFSHISSSEPTKIHAPADLVYNIVADLAGYPEWNVFNPRAVGELRVGATVALDVFWGPYTSPPGPSNLTQVMRVSGIVPGSAFAWTTVVGASALMQAERTQVVLPLSDCECEYRTYDRMSGLLNPIVTRLYGESVVAGFNATAQALKRHAEARFSAQQTARL
eukprot:TRINITY_DN464_c0_g1_i6.p1 TRINITY_DN464_c0_g1~~TRINITY_DN464_c0_g1_i6.p1  ORF type:complete len:186 (-),score=33.44 TRINITY_DN464_c0_g1_i6:52-609(-)